MRKQCIEIANRIFGVLVGELTVFAAISNFISTVQKMSKTSTTCISQSKLGYAVISNNSKISVVSKGKFIFAHNTCQ